MRNPFKIIFRKFKKTPMPDLVPNKTVTVICPLCGYASDEKDTMSGIPMAYTCEKCKYTIGSEPDFEKAALNWLKYEIEQYETFTKRGSQYEKPESLAFYIEKAAENFENSKKLPPRRDISEIDTESSEFKAIKAAVEFEVYKNYVDMRISVLESELSYARDEATRDRITDKLHKVKELVEQGKMEDAHKEVYQFGSCYSIWYKMKYIYKRDYNIDWYTPHELEPFILYD